MKKNNDTIVSELRKTVSRIERRKRHTHRLYCVRFPRSKKTMEIYYGPFLAKTDEQALSAVMAMSRTVPGFQRKNIYYIGTYCALDGKIVSVKPTLVLGKVNNEN